MTREEAAAEIGHTLLNLAEGQLMESRGVVLGDGAAALERIVKAFPHTSIGELVGCMVDGVLDGGGV